MTTRRSLISGSLAASAALAATPADSPRTGATDLKLGVASYSFREFQRGAMLRGVKQLGVKYLSVKEMHLPYKSTTEERAKAAQQIKAAGLELTSGGVIYLLNEDEADIRFHFQYAKECGMPMIIIGPSMKTLPIIERFVKQYDIKAAIHNHGPEDKHFPSCRDALKAIKDMDPRLGVCIDIGHEVRTGNDLVESVALSGSRLLDFHIKDLKVANDRGSQVAVGDGILPIAGMLRQMKKMNYQGNVLLEYEINADEPLPGMQRSFAYMRGVLAGLNA
ncbi:MAG: sugar phosphate isomerase/epimerase [Bryobacteraceae bacterium]|nr:sugar phosphate isomerase/epimerase [Bryobacteraceae bacterium]